MSKILSSALETIGDTPLVELRRLYDGPGRLLAKLEFQNPGGSIKDRAAKRCLEWAYEHDKLKTKQPVVEMTSGNMGAGLAVCCSILEHPFTAVMSEGNSPQRATMMRALGAKVVLVPQVSGQPGHVTGEDLAAAEAEAKRQVEAQNAYYVDQFYNPGCMLAHLESTGPEIWVQSEGRIHAFVAAVGSGGTFIGVSRFLKSLNQDIRCYAVEPEGCEVLAQGNTEKAGHIIQGTGYGYRPHHWEDGVADDFFAIPDEEVDHWARAVSLREGFCVGYSAGANVAAAMRYLKINPDHTVATVLCDTGLKYSWD